MAQKVGRREKLAHKVGRREKLAQKVGRREIYPPVPLPPPPLNETGFENRKVSTRNLVGGFIKQLVGSRQRSFSSRFTLSRRERPLLAGKAFGGLCPKKVAADYAFSSAH